MGRWQNFSIWRGRLPHWRADDVTYYLTFRHRRPLAEPERLILFRALLKTDGSRLHIIAQCVLPEASEMIAAVGRGPDHRPYELSRVVEKAKIQAGKQILQKSGERFAPFYSESYDRIVRDEAELQERLEALIGSAVEAELAEDPGEYATLYLRDAPR